MPARRNGCRDKTECLDSQLMRIATWNINGVKARLDNLLHWLKDSAPDVVCLQEIKCVDEAFPALEIGDLGYNVAVHGQKGFNGVALLAKSRIEDVHAGAARQ